MFGDKLLEIRKEMGFTSALSFYQSLEGRSKLEFNYAYLKKMENNEKLPSVKIIHHLVGLLPKKYGEELIQSFCSSQFPKHTHLFKGSASKESKVTIKTKKSGEKKKNYDHTIIGQQELTERQVAIIASSPEHFYLFSLLTLARRPLLLSELENFFGGAVLGKCLIELETVKLLFQEGDEIHSSYPEYRYPRAETKSLKEAYRKLDDYEITKLKFFNLEKRTRAQFFRRISPRYLDLIVYNIELLYQTIRMADDFDADQNELACSLSLRLDVGEIPG